MDTKKWAEDFVRRSPGRAVKTVETLGGCSCFEDGCTRCERYEALAKALYRAHRCMICARELTDDQSKKAGIGPDCNVNLMTEAAALTQHR